MERQPGGGPETASAATPDSSRLVLLNPGPVNVDERVRQALLEPDVCHREPEAEELMRRVRDKTVRICGGDERHAAVLLTGSGTAALEATVSSVVPADGRLLVLDNGNYGRRLRRIASVYGIDHTSLEFGWGTPVDTTTVADHLRQDPSVTHIAMVHHETSTGMLNDLRTVGRVAADHGCSLLVDAVSSLGGEELDLLADEVDWCMGTANKCLEGLPGISFVVAPRERFDDLASVPPRSYYLDLYGHYRGQNHDGAPLFTPALQVLFAFDRALDLALEEGVANRTARYRMLAERLRNGLAALGFEFFLPPEWRASSVTTVRVPAGRTYSQLHDGLRDRGFVVYACQDELGEMFRIANMGRVTEDDIDRFLSALRTVLDGHADDERPPVVSSAARP